jgi:hypothetical protein
MSKLLEFVDAFREATPEDLAAVRERIASAEQQLAGLRTIEAALAARFAAVATEPPQPTEAPRETPSAAIDLPAAAVAPTGGGNGTKLNGRSNGKPSAPPAPAAATPTPSTAESALQFKRNKVAAYLLDSGPKDKKLVSDRCGIGVQGPHGLSRVLDCDWFHTNPDGVVSLSDKGAKAGRLAVV